MQLQQICLVKPIMLNYYLQENQAMRKWDKGQPQENGGVWKLLEGWAQEIGRADREFNGKEFKGKS